MWDQEKLKNKVLWVIPMGAELHNFLSHKRSKHAIKNFFLRRRIGRGRSISKAVLSFANISLRLIGFLGKVSQAQPYPNGELRYQWFEATIVQGLKCGSPNGTH